MYVRWTCPRLVYVGTVSRWTVMRRAKCLLDKSGAPERLLLSSLSFRASQATLELFLVFSFLLFVSHRIAWAALPCLALFALAHVSES